MVDLLLNFLANFMIECMGLLLLGALAFRWLAYKSCKYDHVYFSTFTKEMERSLEEDKLEQDKSEDVDQYMGDLTDRVSAKLPVRGFRFFVKKKKQKEDHRVGKILSVDDYTRGKGNIINGILGESGAFKAKFPPDYNELTTRILGHDENWNKLFGIIPIEGLSRFIDILPGLFIVLGILGTFVGISLALPEIASIDFNNLEASGEVLSKFVTNITFAMSTSIVGIVFSLVMTLLNTLYPIKGVRDIIFDKVSNTIELLWYTIQGGTTIEKELIKVLPEIRDYVKDLRDRTIKRDQVA